MAQQRPPTSPTSLLWAHQLKREHGYLLTRMQKLEAEIARVDSRTKAVESNTTEHNISALVEQVRALAEDGGKNEADKLRQEIMTRFESVGAEMEAIVQRVSDIEDQEQHDKEKWEREHEVQDSLLKRVEYVESNLQEYASALKKLGRKMDDAQTDKAWTMLAELKDQVKTGQSGLESVAEHMGILEEVSQELKAQNVKLAEQFEELAQRPVSDTEPVAGPAVAARSATRGRTPVSNETPTPSPESKKRATVKTKTKTKTATSLRAKQSDASGAKQFAKPAPTGVKKSRAPVAAKPKSEATVAAPNRDARLGPVQKRKAGKDLDSSIVRSGPGWVEVAESSDDDENEKDNGLEGSPSLGLSGRPSRRAASIRQSVEDARTGVTPSTKLQDPTKQEQSHQARAPAKARRNRLLSTLMDDAEASRPRQTRSQAPAQFMPKTRTNRPIPKTNAQAPEARPKSTASKITKKAAPQKSQRKVPARKVSSSISPPPAFTQRMGPDTQHKGIIDSDPESQELPPPPPRKRRSIPQPDGDEIFVKHVVRK